MKKSAILLFSILALGLAANATERVEMLPFGDFEQWVVRYLKDSKLLGGQQRTLYAIGPTDTIRGNIAYEYGRNGNPWSVSNAYARVSGIDKASGTTRPERRGDGWCARMDSKLETVRALGIINLNVLIAGTAFTGRTLEPVGMKGTSDPYGVIDMGVPFTKKPVTLMVDYKAVVEQSNIITHAKATPNPRRKEGRQDCAQIYILLQHRWEDPDGTIHARRVGTGYLRIMQTVPEWQNDYRIPIRWGDITQQPGYKDYEGLNMHGFKACNAKGRIVPIHEEGYGLEAPTHAILFLSCGSYEAFVGHDGNTLWVDNVRLVYDE